jgi:hypothetical protein
MTFIDDPRAEDWDKHGRVYRPATIVIKSNSPLGGHIKSNENLDLFDRNKRKGKKEIRKSFNRVRLPKHISTKRVLQIW